MSNYNFKKNSTDIGCGGAIGVLLGVIALWLLLPLVIFWIGYFDGWLAMKLIGGRLTQALNILFNTDYFTKDMLPWVGGALAWMGSFFKSISNKNKN